MHARVRCCTTTSHWDGFDSCPHSICMPFASGGSSRVFVSIGPFLDDRNARDDLIWMIPINDTCLAALVAASLHPCSSAQTQNYVDLALWQDATSATRWTAYPIVPKDTAGCCIGVLTIGLAPPWVPGWAPPDATIIDVPWCVKGHTPCAAHHLTNDCHTACTTMQCILLPTWPQH